MTHNHEHRPGLDAMAAKVRQKHAEALEPLPPRPPGCPVCGNWKLRDGETRQGLHVSSCPGASALPENRRRTGGSR